MIFLGSIHFDRDSNNLYSLLYISGIYHLICLMYLFIKQLNFSLMNGYALVLSLRRCVEWQVHIDWTLRKVMCNGLEPPYHPHSLPVIACCGSQLISIWHSEAGNLYMIQFLFACSHSDWWMTLHCTLYLYLHDMLTAHWRLESWL